MKQTYQLIDEQRRSNAINFIKQLPVDADKPLVIEIKERTRSLDQNAKLWACLTDISNQVIWYEKKLSPTDWKHIFTASLEKQKSTVGIDGGVVVLGQSTSRMSVKQLRDLIEVIHAFGAGKGVKFGDEALLAKQWAGMWGGK